MALWGWNSAHSWGSTAQEKWIRSARYGHAPPPLARRLPTHLPLPALEEGSARGGVTHACFPKCSPVVCGVFTLLLSPPLLLRLAAGLVQAGLIRTDSSDYFIEPLEWGQQEQEASGRTHVVYRREVRQQEWAEPGGDLHNEGRHWAGP